MRSAHDEIMCYKFRGKPSSCKKEDLLLVPMEQAIVSMGLEGRHHA
jgi:hypothetical protein